MPDPYVPPKRLASLFSATDDVPEAGRNLWIRGLTADSRAVQPGFLFAALPGQKTKGTEYIPQALEKGASAILAGPQALGELSVPVVNTVDPRRALALAAARFYGKQPATIVAVTGTNGKTSVSVFVRQIWERAGRAAASLGTIGLVAPGGAVKGSLTTPDPVSLHATLKNLAEAGVTHLALEASSHGLEQRRLDGVELVAGAFTNLSRDHLDYHRTLTDYLRAKLRLFDTLLAKGNSAIADADEPEAAPVARIAQIRGLNYLSIGRAGQTLKLISVTRMPDGCRLVVEAEGERHYVRLPLFGLFQVSNALVAAGLAIATGIPVRDALESLEHLQGASGRLEPVGTHPSGAKVFVDYAHTPEALTTVLDTLRPYAEGRLLVVFGAGGDRDPGKRPMMGDAARRGADIVIVTDDNPRSEDPAAIRSAILKSAPNAEEIGDRAEAIRSAVSRLKAGDILVIAGKGHETGQIVGDQLLPFSDQEEARAALASVGGSQ